MFRIKISWNNLLIKLNSDVKDDRDLKLDRNL